MGNHLAGPQRAKHIDLSDQAVACRGIYLREMKTCSHKNLHTNTNAALFIAAKRWKQPKSSPTNEQLNKIWYRHIMEYDAAIKRSWALIHATAWLNLETLLSKRRQSQKTKHMT